MWTTYFTVYDVDALTRAVEEAGGTVHAGPFDVFDAGRMSVIADPNGAFFALWEPREHIGAEIMAEADSLTWAECYATDVQKGRSFYRRLFGWTFDEMDMGGGLAYTVFKKPGNDNSVCGLAPTMGEGMPSFWLVYFQVDGCDATASSASELGGQVKTSPTDIPGVGRFAIIEDPQGATFGILEPDLEAMAQGQQ